LAIVTLPLIQRCVTEGLSSARRAIVSAVAFEQAAAMSPGSGSNDLRKSGVADVEPAQVQPFARSTA
jgi:hypothetical protein